MATTFTAIPRRWTVAILGALLSCASPAALAVAGDGVGIGTDALDTKALTTDLSINVPTSWWTYAGLSGAQVVANLSANAARLTDIEVQSLNNGEPVFTVRMVRNSGDYAAPGGWAWYAGLTSAQVAEQLTANGARLIDLEPYDAGGGAIRFAAIMVSNAGTSARSWWWYHGVNSAQISSVLAGRRLIDLDSYVVNGVKLYTAVMIANSGGDSENWEWWLNQTPAGISARVQAFGGRVIKLDRQADGTYNFIQVKNSGTESTAWWYYFGFRNLTELLNYANQLSARPVDVVTYLNGSGVRRWDATFIDNANASTRRMRSLLAPTFLDSSGNPTRGIFSYYLKQVGATVKVNLNSSRRAEVASSLKALHLLHSMRRVAASTDTLGSAFTYYEYDPIKGKDACPNPALETNANKRTNYTFEKGLDEMMNISDNRTTRGVVIRYGGFAPLNGTATTVGMVGTTLRHNIGCAYYNLVSDKYQPTTLRNDTTAEDLALIYEGVWTSGLLTSVNSAKEEFLESANPSLGVNADLQAIINEEANKLGKGAIAAQFGSLVERWGKGGSYNTCLGGTSQNCVTPVIVRSGAGLIRLPIKVNGNSRYRNYVFARFISDNPVTMWGSNTDVTYTNAYAVAANELYRDEIRSALQTW